MSCARVVAQAKLNLGLRVLARETTGFHSIETVFARLELGDRVVVRTTARSRSIDCAGADVGPAEANLAYRAALAYAELTGWPQSFAIEIEKVVPIGGGLGGGSADAGAVLRALNALAPHPVPEEGLLALARALGSDVPFLTTTAPLALAWGRGERMLALPALSPRPVALVLPGFAVSTRDAYAWLADDRGGEWPAVSAMMRVAQLGAWRSLAALTANDFEPVVAARHPELPAIIDALRRAGADIAHMTGSGSTVYGIFAHPPDAATLARMVTGRVVMSNTAQRVSPVEIEGCLSEPTP
jgi:4-diphosphocytidyl-2-C-methyl-D-erythritol kinase